MKTNENCNDNWQYILHRYEPYVFPKTWLENQIRMNSYSWKVVSLENKNSVFLNHKKTMSDCRQW